MNLGIKGLRVLVTAGAGGIGLEIARAFVAEGARVHICDVDAKALRALAKSDPKITRSKADVSDRKQVAKLFKEALATLKGLDVLVNNAGIAGPTGKVDEIAPEDWDRTRRRHTLMGTVGIIPLHFSPKEIRTTPATVIQQIKDALESGLDRPPLPIRTIPCPTSALKIR